ncbi:L domain-like protein, partial [Neocallimastix lanati (nom. inval.)]
MKINLLLKGIGLSILSGLTLASSTNDCTEIESKLKKEHSTDEVFFNSYLKKCEVNNAGKVISLEINNIYHLFSDKLMKEVFSYDTLTDVSYNIISETKDFTDFLLETLLNLPNLKNLEYMYSSYSESPTTFHRYFKSSESFKFKGPIEKLHLYGFNLTKENGEDISNLSSLKDIKFEEYTIDNFDYNDLKKVVSLELINNNGKKIDFNSLKKNTNLKKLNVNSITITPSDINDISSMSNLKELKINNISEKSLNMKLINNLTGLTSLSLSVHSSDGDKIDYIFKDLKNLEYLHFHYIDNIKSTIFSKLTKLEKFNLEGNKISSLPESIDNLSQLKYLYIDYNEISKIPDFFSDLENLKFFDAQDNKITKFPEVFSQIKNLEELILQFNKIDDVIPESYNNIPKLKTFDIDGNSNVRGKTLTNPTLEFCDYSDYGKKVDICITKDMPCLIYSTLEYCSDKITTTSTKKTTTTTKKSSTTNSQTTSTSGKCGGGVSCPSGQCCSKYGYCGTTEKYCGSGCQSEFGKCNSSSKTTKATTTTTKKTTTTK